MNVDDPAQKRALPARMAQRQVARDHPVHVIDVVSVRVHVNAAPGRGQIVDAKRAPDAHRMNLTRMSGQTLRKIIIHELELGSIAVEEFDHSPRCECIDATPALRDCARPVHVLLSVAEDMRVEGLRDGGVYMLHVKAPVPHDRNIECSPFALGEQRPQECPYVMVDACRRRAPQPSVVHLNQAVDALDPQIANRGGGVSGGYRRYAVGGRCVRPLIPRHATRPEAPEPVTPFA